MARMARTVVPDKPHHITQRGNNRQDVFFVDDDRRVYWPLGTDSFISKLEKLMGRRMRPLPLGRPRKNG